MEQKASLARASPRQASSHMTYNFHSGAHGRRNCTIECLQRTWGAMTAAFPF
jgi:hypothetical protein